VESAIDTISPGLASLVESGNGMSEFTCRSEHLDDSYAVLVCGGEIDLYTSDRLKSELAGLLRENRTSRVVVDLSDVRFIDSAGFGVLIIHQRQADEQLRIVVTRADVMRLFCITGLDKVLSIHSSRAGAVASFA
jgi:anti-sigma B factor antagonist